jgi:hypothetical protein
MKPEDVLTAIDTDIQSTELRLEQLRTVRVHWTALYGELSADVQPLRAPLIRRQSVRNGAPPRKVVAAGSLPDRILSTLKEAGEPTKFSVIVASGNALEPDVKKALRELVEQARVVQSGVRAGTRYALP